MTWAAIVLIGIGVADLVRSTAPRPARVWAHVTGPVTIAVVTALTGLFRWADLLAMAAGAVGAALWIELSDRAQRDGRHPVRALSCLGLLLVGLVAFGGAASTPDGALGTWLRWADLPGQPATSSARVLLVAALVLGNLATANVVVRLVLLATGALRPARLVRGAPPQASDQLKGGRLLGPMERLIILGLGLAGEFAAAGLVIAAKGLLRFPEIQAAARKGGGVGSGGVGSGGTGATGATVQAGSPASPTVSRYPPGIDEVTEYFLVGSFVSWLVALAALALAA